MLSYYKSLSLRTKNSIILIGVMLPLLVSFLAYDLYRQTTSMKNALTRRGVILAQTGAEITSKILTDAIKYGKLTEAQLFDQNYRLIPGTSPPRYHTAYDAYTDENLRQVEDAFLKDKMIVFAVAVDTKGYLPTHNTKFSKTGGGLDVDRSKRLFDDKVGNAAARNTKPYLFQEYDRDTGEVMWDISSPIYVHGRQWGAFRIGFSIDETNKTIAGIRNQIIGAGAILMVALVLLSVLISNRISEPVRQLEEEANRVAQGDLSVREFKTRSSDEVGNLVRSFGNMITRLRDLAERTRFSAGLIGTFTKELRESSENATGTASIVSSNVIQIKDSLRELETGTQSIVQISDRTVNTLTEARTNSKKFVDYMDKSSVVLSRAGDAVQQLESQVEKVGSIIQFISILTEQAGQIAKKAAKHGAEMNPEDSEFHALAEEIQSRAEEASVATKGIAGLFDGIREFAQRAMKTLHEDRDIIMEGNKVASQSFKSLNAIVTDLQELNKQVKGVVDSSRQIIGSINSINSAVEEQTGLVVQFSEATGTLETIAVELEETLASLKV